MRESEKELGRNLEADNAEAVKDYCSLPGPMVCLVCSLTQPLAQGGNATVGWASPTSVLNQVIAPETCLQAI